MEFFTRYNPGKSPSVSFSMPSMTEQYHRSEVDINSIIARYNKTGVFGSPSQLREVVFGDFTACTDRLEFELTVSKAKQEFLKLPSNVRSAFNNDPYQMLQELDSGEHLQKFIDLGIVKKPAPVVGTVENPGDVSHVIKTDEGVGTVLT